MRQGASKEVLELLIASWSAGTLKKYATPINRWLQYCQDNGIDPFNAQLMQGAQFLATLFHSTKLKYSSFNVTRSALSIFFAPVNGVPFGKHPVITRMMKGIFKERPSLPKYTVTYEASVVLNFMTSLPPNRDNSLEVHTYKLATLMCLLSGQRAQTLASLILEDMHVDNDKCVFYISSLMKQSRPKFHTAPLEFLSYADNRNICVVECVNEYLDRTVQFRKDKFEGPLFLSYSAPHKQITTRTLSRYLCKFLDMAGIDIKTFQGHSTRSSSTSADASCGLSLTEISRATGWSNAKTFQEHYNKPIKENFGRTLQNRCKIMEH